MLSGSATAAEEADEYAGERRSATAACREFERRNLAAIRAMLVGALHIGNLKVRCFVWCFLCADAEEEEVEEEEECEKCEENKTEEVGTKGNVIVLTCITENAPRILH